MRKTAIGIDIGGTSVKLGVVSAQGKVLFREAFPTRSARSRDALLSAISASVIQLKKAAKAQGWTVSGVGIGAPGAIDVERGFVHFFPNISGWKNTPLASILSKKLKMPVRVDNDANAMAYAESVFGAGRGARHVIALTLGTGVGGGLVIDGKLFHGSTFSAAEMGHMSVNENGPLCACGNRGCIETYVGNGYFTREAARRMKTRKSILKKWQKAGQPLTPKLVAQAARRGDPLSRQLWAETGAHLGTYLAGLANLLNPERIIIGGGLAQSGSLLFGPLQRAFKKKAFPIAARSARVVKARLGVDAGLVGAAALILF